MTPTRRPVPPLSWRIYLRDQGPPGATLHHTLLALSVWMHGFKQDAQDDKPAGFAWPGQPRLARGARLSVRTVKLQLQTAVRLGWLHRDLAGNSAKRWRHYVYRACVPPTVILSPEDQQISAELEAMYGPIQEYKLGDDPPDRLSAGGAAPAPPLDDYTAEDFDALHGGGAAPAPASTSGGAAPAPARPPISQGGAADGCQVVQEIPEGGAAHGRKVVQELHTISSSEDRVLYRVQNIDCVVEGFAEDFQKCFQYPPEITGDHCSVSVKPAA